MWCLQMLQLDISSDLILYPIHTHPKCRDKSSPTLFLSFSQLKCDRMEIDLNLIFYCIF